jgi:hypothetical protein
MKSLPISSILLTLALTGCSGSNEDPQSKIAEITDRLCKTMSIIGYDPSESAIQTLDESLQRQLLADIDELKVLAPSVLDRRLAELCK